VIINQPEGSGFLRTKRQAPGHDCLRRLRANSSRQQVGPIFRAVQIPHIAIMWVQYDAAARQNAVGCERQKYPAGRRIAPQCRYRQMRVCAQDVVSQKSSMWLMFSHEASAGLSAASMQCRCIPLLQKSAPPISTITRVGWRVACA
jgi:hypothetical protein